MSDFFKKMAGIGLSCLLLGGYASAQDMLDGSFTGNFPPKDWNVESVAGSRSWSMSWGGGADGGNYAVLYAQDAGTLNDAWMISPQVRPSAENHRLVFWTRKAAADTTAMTLSVYVSATGNSMADFSAPALMSLQNTETEQDFSLSWKSDTLDLSAYEGQDIFVAFRVQDNAVQIYLDEISGLPLSEFETDFRINSLSLVPDNILFAGGDAVRLQALVENRVNEEASVTVSFSVDGQVVGTDVVEFDSAYVDTAYVEYAFAEAAMYAVKVSVPEDDNNINNEQEMEVRVYPENFLMEDFNANKPFPPQEWQAIVEKGNAGIDRSTSATDAATSTAGYVDFTTSYSSSVENPSVRWLVSPQLRPTAEHHEISFYLRRGTVYGTPVYSAVSVMLSVASSTPEDFTAELRKFELSADKDDLGSSDWMPFSIDLSDYQGQDIFLAFRVEDCNTVTWNLDEVGGIPMSAFAQDARIRMFSMADPYKYCFAGEYIEVRAVADNHGMQAMESMELSFSVNGETESVQNISLDAKEVSDTLSFVFTPQEAGFYQFALSVPEDDNNVNNTMELDSVQVYPEGFFIEGFEGLSYGELPKYWACDMASWGSNGWGTTLSSYEGTNAFSSLEGKLVTPLLHVDETDSLCFYVNTNGWDTAAYLILSSVDAKTWDTVYKGFLNNKDYKLQTIYFSEASQEFYGNRYFAFLCTLNYMCIDKVFGPMLAARDDQFRLVSLSADPETVNVAGRGSAFQVVLYNDGTETLSKEVSLYYGEELLASAQSGSLAPGTYDTLRMMHVFEKSVSNAEFRAVLPEDAYLFDNEASLTTHIYEPELWRMEEGFEDVSHPYWTLGDNGWQSKPSYNAVEPAGGENYLNRSFSAGFPSVAVSPYMDLRYAEYEISIDVYRNAATPDRPDRIELAFGAKPVWEDVVFVDSINRVASNYPEGTAGWGTYVFKVDLSDLQSGFFMIRAVGVVNEYGSPSYENLPIDNLCIRPVLAHDAELVSLLSPADGAWAADSVKTAIRVVLMNNGEEALTAATLRYGYGDTETGVCQWVGSMVPGTDTTLLLTSDLHMPAMDSLQVFVEVEAEGDENVLNDRIEKLITCKYAYELPFVANFEDSTWDKEWQNFTFSPEGLLWRRDTTGEYVTAPFGQGCAYSASLDDDLGAVHPDNWFVTPGLSIEHPKAWLSFYVQAADRQYFAESYSVLVSTRSDKDTAFFTPIYADTLTSDSLQHVVLSLDGYKGEVINIAFRHHNCTDNYRLLLDSVHVYYPELFEVTATVNPEEAGTVAGTGEYIMEEEVLLAATGNEGWTFSGWYQDGSLASTENPYRFECDGDAQYEARFEQITYTITLNAGEGGTVSPSGTQTVRHGEDLAVTITPEEGYVVEGVLVDGASVGAVEAYTFEKVTADHSLEASFKPDAANEAGEMAVLEVYPNPYTEELHVSSALPMERIRFVDLHGKEAARYEIGGGTKAALRPALPEGLYLLMVEYANGQNAVCRIVKTSR